MSSYIFFDDKRKNKRTASLDSEKVCYSAVTEKVKYVSRS